VLTNTPVLLRAIAIGPCGLIWVKFYDGATYLGDAVAGSTGGYDLTVSSFAPGTHQLSAVALLDSGTTGEGELETSAPVDLVVLAPGQPPDYHGP
jgi:hypothetical protein